MINFKRHTHAAGVLLLTRDSLSAERECTMIPASMFLLANDAQGSVGHRDGTAACVATGKLILSTMISQDAGMAHMESTVSALPYSVFAAT